MMLKNSEMSSICDKVVETLRLAFHDITNEFRKQNKKRQNRPHLRHAPLISIFRFSDLQSEYFVLKLIFNRNDFPKK